MQGRETVTDLVLRAVKRRIPFRHYRVFYFGSRVAGGATARSDYDVGIEHPKHIGRRSGRESNEKAACPLFLESSLTPCLY